MAHTKGCQGIVYLTRSHVIVKSDEELCWACRKCMARTLYEANSIAQMDSGEFPLISSVPALIVRLCPLSYPPGGG
jgi:Fe-S-cluster-containing dehydrogenase component